MEFKTRIVKSERLQYYTKCLKCRKEVSAWSEEHLKLNMDLHLDKHKREDEN